MENLFKAKYTQADIDELKTWFDRHADQLPTEFVLNESTRYLNLPTAIKSFFEIWNIHHDNPTFSGQIYQLFLIRQKLIADGMTDWRKLSGCVRRSLFSSKLLADYGQ